MTQDADTHESLADLSEGEQIVLAALVRLMVRSDGELSGREREQVDAIAGDAGEDFWRLMDAASESEADQEAILEQAAGLERVSAHELIYGTLYELSIADVSDGSENDLLDRLAATWNLKIQDVQ